MTRDTMTSLPTASTSVSSSVSREPLGPVRLDDPLRELQARLEVVLSAATPVAVAFSGGVDSSLLYAEARRVLGSRAIAAIGVSASLARADLDHARGIARWLRAPLLELATSELESDAYRANAGDRCFHCKTELFTRLGAAPELAGWTVCDGTNADDLASDRPGMKAATQRGVRSPLREAGFTKDAIRALARAWELPNWDRPAQPCLASRVKVGTAVDAAVLADVEALEEILFTAGFRVLRARVEVRDVVATIDAQELDRMGLGSWREAFVAEARRRGYRRVLLDMDGYRAAASASGEGRTEAAADGLVPPSSAGPGS